MPEALKGRRLTRHRGTYPEMPVAPSGLLTSGCVSQGKPWVNPGLSSHGPLGRDPTYPHPSSREDVQTPEPGTSCLATIVLSLRDENHSPIAIEISRLRVTVPLTPATGNR